jgi:hypothetical protein
MHVVADLRPANVGGVWSLLFASMGGAMISGTAATSNSRRTMAPTDECRRGFNASLEDLMSPSDLGVVRPTSGLPAHSEK